MTGLRCSRCGKPICPQCAVRTPVGLRCPDCAGVRGLPTYRTPTSDLVRAVGAGLGIAIVVAVIWRFFPDWQFYLNLLLGFGAIETMARVAKYKRGVDLQAAAIGVVVFGMLLARVLVAQRFGIALDDLNHLDYYVQTRDAIETFNTVPQVQDVLQIRLIPDVLYAALPIAIAWYRFR